MLLLKNNFETIFPMNQANFSEIRDLFVKFSPITFLQLPIIGLTCSREIALCFFNWYQTIYTKK